MTDPAIREAFRKAKEIASVAGEVVWLARLENEIAEALLAERGILDQAIEQFEKRTIETPIGHEHIGHGASTYNWRVAHLNEIKGSAAALRKAKTGA